MSGLLIHDELTGDLDIGGVHDWENCKPFYPPSGLVVVGTSNVGAGVFQEFKELLLQCTPSVRKKSVHNDMAVEHGQRRGSRTAMPSPRALRSLLWYELTLGRSITECVS